VAGSETPLPAVKKSTSVVKVFGIAFLLCLIIGICLVIASVGPSPNTEPLATATSAPALNDAELLISRCGKPNRDDSTENDNPRPPIVTRIIEYRKAHLKYAFVPGGGSKVGDPPPYKWKSIGVVDTRTNKAIPAAQLRDVLSKQLLCALGQESRYR